MPASLAVSSRPPQETLQARDAPPARSLEAPCAFTQYEPSTISFHIYFKISENPSALANGFILLVDVAEEMETQHFSPRNSSITH